MVDSVARKVSVQIGSVVQEGLDLECFDGLEVVVEQLLESG